MIPARGPQTKLKQNTHCPQVLRAKHLWTMSVLHCWFAKVLGAGLGKSRQVG